ncbi:MAG: flagellar basal body P-ring protein FlgI [Candidatus Glassbacteria bacterium]|nr:flagellar basal body P-ring protein FlgI [Candidatus Glassbacteria bacterium]
MTAYFLSRHRQYRWNRILAAALLIPLVSLLATPLWGARIKDIAHLQGTRSEQLIGYGLVVGLDGTGDGRTIFTNRSTASLLNKFGVEIQGNEINAANVAAVMVTTELNSFVKPGSRIDVTVSSIGEAESLQGGTLLRTQLFGYDGRTLYAVCQGPISIGGFVVGVGGAGAGAQIQRNHTVVGRIPGGAQVLQPIESEFIENWKLMLTLDKSDFTSVNKLDEAIDNRFGADIGVPIDGLSVIVNIPEEYRDPGKIVQFISTLENLEIIPEVAARVVINERTGTIAIGENVTVLPVQVAHGGLTISVGTGAAVSQPTSPLAGGGTILSPTAEASAVEEVRKFLEMGGTAGDLVTALNSLQITPRDIIAIFQAIKEAGALAAELVIM